MPLIWSSVAFMGGILTADQLPGSLSCWLGLFGVAFLCLSALLLIPLFWGLRSSKLSSWTIGLLCIVSFSLGAIRYLRSLPDFEDPGFIAKHASMDRRMVVTGIVKDFPDVRDEYISLILDVETLRDSASIFHREVTGTILGRVPVGEEVKYGDRIVLRGFLEIPPEDEDFSYRSYLAMQGIYAYMPTATVGVIDSGHGTPLLAAIYNLKRAGLKTIYEIWPDPEASLLCGILLGEESGIPEPVEVAFQDTGTSHIIAISGFNITIVAGFLAALSSRFLKPIWAAVTAAIGIGFYTVLVGADPAVVRAAWMGGLALFARQVGRRQHGLNAVAVASLVMAAINPQIPWDVSFQLSLAATLGLILYAQDMTDWFLKTGSHWFSPDFANRLAKPVSEYVLFTFAAQVTTFPVLLYHFQRVSWISFLANPVILPAQPPIMILGGLALIMGLVWVPLAKPLGLLVYPFVAFTIRVVEFFADLQGGAYQVGRITLLGVILFYALIVLLTFGRRWLGALSQLVKPSLGLAVLLLGNVLVWRSSFFGPDNYLHLTVFEVGTGTAILMQSPEGERVLINGGPSTSALADGLGRRISLLDHDVDLLVVASTLEEDIASLIHLGERSLPRKVLWIGGRSPSRAADYLRARLQESGMPLLEGEPGTVIQVGEEVQIAVLTKTVRGGILLLSYGRFRALLPFGVSQDCIYDLRDGRDVGHVSLLMLADSGYLASNPKSWIDNLNPRLILLSVAPDDPEGLPSQALLAEMAGYSLLRTDMHGWIEITTDGGQMWIDVARLP